MYPGVATWFAQHKLHLTVYDHTLDGKEGSHQDKNSWGQQLIREQKAYSRRGWASEQWGGDTEMMKERTSLSSFTVRPQTNMKENNITFTSSNQDIFHVLCVNFVFSHYSCRWTWSFQRNFYYFKHLWHDPCLSDADILLCS